MKKTTFVAFLLLASTNLFAGNLISEINLIESNWATTYYSENSDQQSAQYPALIRKTQELSKKYPDSIEPIIWKAILIATNAAYESPFSALESITNAKELLEYSIKKQPEALEGAAHVVLATLYYMTPGWPISFGNNERAEYLFQTALRINPLSIDSNYFYGDYLLSQGDTQKAQIYFKKALEAPVRQHQKYADTQLKQEALTALKQTQNSRLASGKNKFISLFSSANAK